MPSSLASGLYQEGERAVLSSKTQKLALLVFGLFFFWTIYLCQGYNYVTFFKPLFAVGPGVQVLTDLTIAMSLILIWIYHDCQKAGRRFWVYFVITLFLGSFGPLLYFILRKPEAMPSALT